MIKRLQNGLTVDISHPEISNHKFVLYFHGGGLIYGSKSDFPNALKQIFLSKGYTTIALDYLLAPNSSLKTIFDKLIETFDIIKDTIIKDNMFSFCGRSAGGYLMFWLTNYLFKNEQKVPLSLINFYGYTDLNFINLSRSLSGPVISKGDIQNINLIDKISDDPYMKRYLLYIYAVQNNLLKEYYQLSDNDSEKYGIHYSAFKSFPKTFSSASSSDKEIPFKYSKAVSKFNTESIFVPTYYLEHDFLSKTDDPQVLNVFEKLSSWL